MITFIVLCFAPVGLFEDERWKSGELSLRQRLIVDFKTLGMMIRSWSRRHSWTHLSNGLGTQVYNLRGHVGEEVGLGGDMFTAIVRWAMTVCTSRKACPLRSTPVRLAIPCDWVVTQGLLRGRFWLCRMTCTRRES
jgi:hypothetical protein